MIRFTKIKCDKVADEKFCETTIGCKDPDLGNEFKLLFQTANFRFGCCFRLPASGLDFVIFAMLFRPLYV